MTPFAGARVALLDIEGTIAPLAYVRDVLFPAAREQLAEFLTRRWNDPAVVAARAQVAQDAPDAATDRAGLVGHLHELMAVDAKATGLKVLQGLIWEEGFTRGTLRAEIYGDVPALLRRRRDAGLRCAIYSSGSVAAQQLYLGNSDQGDLRPLIEGYFDTRSGAKREPLSYRNIAAELGVAPKDVAFASDVPLELHAAALAGMAAVLVVRPGNPAVDPAGYPCIRSFDEWA